MEIGCFKGENYQIVVGGQQFKATITNKIHYLKFHRFYTRPVFKNLSTCTIYNTL